MSKSTFENQASSRLESTDTIYEVRNASVTFDMDRGHSKVLDDVSMNIYRDEVLGIVGESGSGKSMFASSLLDAVVEPGQLSGEITYYPDDGDQIHVNEISKDELREFRWEHVSMVFQGAMSSFNPTLSIKDHFKETLQAHDFNVREGLNRAKEILSDLHLDPERVLDSYPHELSGGMSQRALIALSLILDPDVLVMDEPTASLDLLMQRSILRLIRDIKEKYGITIVIISHDLPLVAELADRIAVMYAYEFAELGTTEEIIKGATHPYTRALLKATPNVDAPIETMEPVEGSSPDPVDVPSGCSFHPRCPLSTHECEEEDPGFHTVSESQESACFHWEESADAIPFDNEIETVESPETPDRTVGTGMDLLSIEDLEVHFEAEQQSFFQSLFGSPDIVRAVDGVSLDIAESDVVALVGESGCGKTTLGKTAIGLHQPTNGSVNYRGTDIQEAKNSSGKETSYAEIRRALQIIHQDPGSSLNPNRKVIKILEEPLKKWQSELDRDDREARILGMLEHVGMTPPHDYAGRYSHQLSGGEKQRIALIRALLMNPDLILADEAISALDVSLRIEMMDLFLDLQDEFDTSFLFISHDISNARYLTEKAGGRIGVMYLGKIVEIGPAREVIHNPQHPYTQTLMWATPDLDIDSAKSTETPLRTVDIPDPINPPSGCRFHTRCPEAREACTDESPANYHVGTDHSVTCFRADPDHRYWNSTPLTDESDQKTTAENGSDGAVSD